MQKQFSAAFVFTEMVDVIDKDMRMQFIPPFRKHIYYMNAIVNVALSTLQFPPWCATWCESSVRNLPPAWHFKEQGSLSRRLSYQTSSAGSHFCQRPCDKDLT